MQRAADAGPEGKEALPVNVRIREQEHWNVVVKKQIRRGRRGSQEPLAVEGWTGAFVYNPRKRHLKVDRGLVTVCGAQDAHEAKPATKKRGRGAQGKENTTSADASALDATPEWLLSALLQLKEAPVDYKTPVKSETECAPATPCRQTAQQTSPSQQPAAASGEVKRRSFKPSSAIAAATTSQSPPPSAVPATRTSPVPAHAFTYSCRCSSCLTAMIPVPFQYGQR